MIVSLDRDEDGLWITEPKAYPVGLRQNVRQSPAVSARVRHREKNEKKSTRKAFEKAWCRVDTRREQAQHISEGQPKNASSQT